MTIARDPRTGVVLGQTCELPTQYLPERLGEGLAPVAHVTLLTRGGRYVTVPAHSVRLEELR